MRNLLKLLGIAAVIFVLAKSVLYALDLPEENALKRDNDIKSEGQNLLSSIKKFNDKNNKFPWDGPALLWTAADKIKLDEVIKYPEHLFVGSGGSANDKIWACYIPISKHERVDRIKLRSLGVGESLPPNGIPKECDINPDWKNSFCFICVAE